MNTVSIVALLFCATLLVSAATLGLAVNWVTVLGAVGVGYLLRGVLE